jgi:hypothetical protein
MHQEIPAPFMGYHLALYACEMGELATDSSAITGFLPAAPPATGMAAPWQRGVWVVSLSPLQLRWRTRRTWPSFMCASCLLQRRRFNARPRSPDLGSKAQTFARWVCELGSA